MCPEVVANWLNPFLFAWLSGAMLQWLNYQTVAEWNMFGTGSADGCGDIGIFLFLNSPGPLAKAFGPSTCFSLAQCLSSGEEFSVPHTELRNTFSLALYGRGEKREQDQLCSKHLLLTTAHGEEEGLRELGSSAVSVNLERNPCSSHLIGITVVVSAK